MKKLTVILSDADTKSVVELISDLAASFTVEHVSDAPQAPAPLKGVDAVMVMPTGEPVRYVRGLRRRAELDGLVLRELSLHGQKTVSELVKAIKLSEHAVLCSIKRLTDEQKVIEVKEDGWCYVRLREPLATDKLQKAISDAFQMSQPPLPFLPSKETH